MFSSAMVMFSGISVMFSSGAVMFSSGKVMFSVGSVMLAGVSSADSFCISISYFNSSNSTSAFVISIFRV
ncbi:MAG: hypothetical protein KJ600_00760 [Nanoarchaeota archaeon]|nr:hypothetical protein [Nanoarchaeota archaeon]MBU1103073.1 hypothetical protein [Nanoarchaeota archaeon]